MSQYNFHKLNGMLVHSCNRVLRDLLPVVIERERPSAATTIDELIRYDWRSLGSKRIVKLNAFLVFPSNSIVRIDRWHLQLLCFFIEYVCPPNDIICHYIKALKDIRNHMCHTPNGLIYDEDYQVQHDDIKIIINNFLDIIGDATLKGEIEGEIAEIDNGTRSIPEAADILKEWLDRDKHQRTPIDNISAEQQEIIDRLRTIQGNLPVPDAEIDILVENADSIQQQDQVSQTLVNILDPNLQSDPDLSNLTETQYKAIEVKVHECMDSLLESGQVVVGATPGCVIITVRSNTFASLERLWKKLVSAEIDVIMAPLQEILRKKFSERLTIKAVLPECSFLEVAGRLVKEIQANDGCDTQIPDAAGGMEMSNSQSVINFKIKPKSLEDYERLDQQLSEGQLETTFKKITDVLQQELNAPNLRVSARRVRPKVLHPL